MLLHGNYEEKKTGAVNQNKRIESWLIETKENKHNEFGFYTTYTGWHDVKAKALSRVIDFSTFFSLSVKSS